MNFFVSKLKILAIGQKISTVCAAMLIFSLAILGSAWLTRAAVMGSPRLSKTTTAFMLAVASFPRRVIDVIDEFGGYGLPFSYRLLIPKEPDPGRASIGFPSSHDNGYLLFAGVDKQERSQVVKLISVATGADIIVWRPDWGKIAAASSPSMSRDGFDARGLLPTHPLLLANGAVVFTTGFSLVNIDICGKTEWVIPEDFHHSVEAAPDGTLWVPSVSSDGYAWNPGLGGRFRDDAITNVDGSGKVMRRISVAGILERNGLLSILLGSQGNSLNSDPVHLNQISIATRQSAFWKPGDLLLSLRNLSVLLVYRPSTDRVIWLKSGPWVNQHSAFFYGDSKVVLFNNNALPFLSGLGLGDVYLPPSFASGVMTYDFSTGEVHQPFEKMLMELGVRTIDQGRVQLLSDGGVFIEETRSARHLRFSPDRLLWARTNSFDSKTNGAVSWARYLTAEEAAPALRLIGSRSCKAR